MIILSLLSKDYIQDSTLVSKNSTTAIKTSPGTTQNVSPPQPTNRLYDPRQRLKPVLTKLRHLPTRLQLSRLRMQPLLPRLKPLLVRMQHGVAGMGLQLCSLRLKPVLQLTIRADAQVFRTSPQFLSFYLLQYMFFGAPLFELQCHLFSIPDWIDAIYKKESNKKYRISE